jgi:hypothetical protein
MAKPPFVVRYHHDPKNEFKFRQDTPDDEWLAKIGAKGWVALSNDRKWHDETPSVVAIHQHQIGCFYLWGGDIRTWSKLSHFMRNCTHILNIARHAPRPFIYNVTAKSRLERVTIPARTIEAASAPDVGTGKTTL